MEKKNIYMGLLICSILGLASAMYWTSIAEDISIPLVFVAINVVGIIAGAGNLEEADKRTPLGVTQLDKLKSFGREPDTGNYSE